MSNGWVFHFSILTWYSFSAAQLGLPRMMKDEDAQCEYPVDADDEYVTEKGFLPTLPGEFTKLSSALALFKVSRILAKVLSENYPSTASYELSFRTLDSLSDELDEWQTNLPTHLRLQFAQDKPSTNVISSRSPLLVCTSPNSISISVHTLMHPTVPGIPLYPFPDLSTRCLR